MAFLSMTEVSSKHFAVVRDGGTVLVAEASDLRDYNLHQRIYDDAADVGIAIRSERTGQVERFYYSHDDRNPEGELAGQVYRPVKRDSKVKEVLIVND